MGSTRAEHLMEQLRGAVCDQVRLREVGRAVHEDQQLEDAGDRVEVGRCGMERAEKPNRDSARGLLSLRDGDLRTESANPGLTVSARDMSRHEDQIAGADKRYKQCDRRRDRW